MTATDGVAAAAAASAAAAARVEEAEEEEEEAPWKGGVGRGEDGKPEGARLEGGVGSATSLTAAATEPLTEITAGAITTRDADPAAAGAAGAEAMLGATAAGVEATGATAAEGTDEYFLRRSLVILWNGKKKKKTQIKVERRVFGFFYFIFYLRRMRAFIHILHFPFFSVVFIGQRRRSIVHFFFILVLSTSTGGVAVLSSELRVFFFSFFFPLAIISQLD